MAGEPLATYRLGDAGMGMVTGPLGAFVAPAGRVLLRFC